MTIQRERIHRLNHAEIAKGRWVLYWMQQSQRPHDNPALEYAIGRANRLGLPVLVIFCLVNRFPEATRRHYRFMLEGLADTQKALARRRIRMVVRRGDPADVVAGLADDAAMLVCDVGYTRIQRQWRRAVAAAVACRAVAVEGDVVVPAALVSQKAEYAARTIRPKIDRHLARFLTACPRYRPKLSSLNLSLRGIALDDIDQVMDRLGLGNTVPAVTRLFRGGPREAKKRLRRFIRQRLAHYDANRNQPQTNDVSHMSPYLHFGQISPIFVALAVKEATQGLGVDRAAYLEELIVRRELAVNFVYYTGNYDHYACLPQWARKSLAQHARDRRAHLYRRRDLEAGATHDAYWNAAMAEMRHTGFMHNYMRMYWGKKIIEWSGSPQEAYETALALNNKYFLDGRDPNSFAGVGWVFGLHDRAWFERDIFGKVRYMAATGLERKCDIRAYVDKVAALCRYIRKGA